MYSSTWVLRLEMKRNHRRLTQVFCHLHCYKILQIKLASIIIDSVIRKDSLKFLTLIKVLDIHAVVHFHLSPILKPKFA